MSSFSDDPKLKALQVNAKRAAGYVDAAMGGALGGGALGVLLAGGKAIKKGAVAGAIGGIAAERALSKPVRKLYAEDKEIRGDLLGMTPFFAGLATPLGVIAGYSPAMRGAKRAGEAFRGFRQRATKAWADRNKGMVDVVSHVPAGAKYAGPKLLMSARDSLNEIKFGRGDYLLKMTPNMTMPRMQGDALEATIRNQPELLMKYMGHGSWKEAKEAVAQARSQLAPQARNLYKARKLINKLKGLGMSNESSALEFARGDIVKKLLEKGLTVADDYQIARNQAAVTSRRALASDIKHLRKIARKNQVKLLSAREELNSIIELAGGYINTEEGVKKERGVGAHFNRAAGRYIGSTVLTIPIGLPVGYLVDRSRRKLNIKKTKYEDIYPDWMAKGRVLLGALDEIQFARGDIFNRAVGYNMHPSWGHAATGNFAEFVKSRGGNPNLISSRLMHSQSLRGLRKDAAGLLRMFKKSRGGGTGFSACGELDEIKFAAKKLKKITKKPCPHCGKSPCNCQGYSARLEEMQFARGDMLEKLLGFKPWRLGTMSRTAYINKGTGWGREMSKELAGIARAVRKHRRTGDPGDIFKKMGLESGMQSGTPIEFVFDPRPRNQLGMFEDSGDMGPDPNAIDIAYKEPMRMQMAQQNPKAFKKMMKRIKGEPEEEEKEMSAREKLDVIQFGYWDNTSDYNPQGITKSFTKAASPLALMGGMGLGIGLIGGGFAAYKGVKALSRGWGALKGRYGSRSTRYSFSPYQFPNRPALGAPAPGGRMSLPYGIHGPDRVPNPNGTFGKYSSMDVVDEVPQSARRVYGRTFSAKEALNVIKFGYYDEEETPFPKYALAGGTLGAGIGLYKGLTLPGRATKGRWANALGGKVRPGALGPDPSIYEHAKFQGTRGLAAAQRAGRGVLTAAQRKVKGMRWTGRGLLGRGLLGLGLGLFGGWAGGSLGSQLDDAAA